MIPSNAIAKDFPLKTVGSSVFGRYPKISVESTFNMIISDGWLVDYAGYKNVTAQNTNLRIPIPINPNGVGRGAFRSTSLGLIVAVVGNGAYLIDNNINITQIGTLNTNTGDVFIAEDTQTNHHIAICDKKQIWIYTHATGTFELATENGVNPIDFTPGYIAYHNGRFLSVDLESAAWRLSDPANGNSQFPNSSQFVGGFQTKPDMPTAIVAFPGKSNLILVMGSNVSEFWTDVGAALFPYQRSTGINIDYGCLSSDTVAVFNTMVCWLAGNERSGPFIAYTESGIPQKISTDGIDFKLGNLRNPSDSHGFFFRQDGHLIYQLTFPTDNFSIIYDFNTGKFFEVTDENMNYHIAKNAVYFNNTYYFVSLNDGNLYEFDTSITNYDYGYNTESEYIIKEIPRVRQTDTFRLPDGSNFITNAIAIPFEMGVQPDPGMSVAEIIVENPGSGYNEASVLILGGEGQGAEAEVVAGDFLLLDGTQFLLLDGENLELLSTDTIDGIEVTNGGANYAYPPTVTITGDGEGATAYAVLTTNTLPRCDISISANGGQSFGNFVGINFNQYGHYKNRFTYFGLGMSNEFTLQYRLWSQGRFTVGNGIMSVYQ